MARCKECIHYDVCSKEGRMVQVDEHTWDDYNQLDDVERFCDNYIATADVVPKSEVERLQHILNSYALQYGTVKDQHKVIDKAKTEVAREIFEEIEKHLFVIAPIEEFDGWARIQLADIMRLKKKYTEDKNG